MAGFACLSFDYRTFGGSKPKKNETLIYRNLIDPWSHVADVKTVVQAAKDGLLGPNIDSSRIALWGTSFGGIFMYTYEYVYMYLYIHTCI
jgi:predicted alpha/beta hydrolase